MTQLPWYRREPWLALLLAAALPLTVGFIFPTAMKIAFGVSVLVGLMGLVLLVTHRPDAAEERRIREYRREVD